MGLERERERERLSYKVSLTPVFWTDMPWLIRQRGEYPYLNYKVISGQALGFVHTQVPISSSAQCNL